MPFRRRLKAGPRPHRALILLEAGKIVYTQQWKHELILMNSQYTSKSLCMRNLNLKLVFHAFIPCITTLLCITIYSKYPYILATLFSFLFVCFFSFLFATLCAPLSHCLQTSLTHLTRSASLCVWGAGKSQQWFFILVSSHYAELPDCESQSTVLLWQKLLILYVCS